MTPILVAHLLLCLYLTGSVFDRARVMSYRVRRDIRLVFCILGVVAIAGLVAPFVTGWAPDWWSISLLFAISAVQRVTAHHWHGGPPECFHLPGYITHNRRATDVEGSPS